MSKNKNLIIISTILITLGFISRLLPHPANFTSITAIALFAGIYLPKRWAIILPLVAMFVSDLFIGFYTWQIMLSVYASFAMAGIIGLFISKNKRFSTVLGGTVLASLLFFLITNLAVWGFGTMYTHNLSGLIECYAMAIPFFKNSLLGDLFYTGVMVGSLELVILSQKSLKTIKI